MLPSIPAPSPISCLGLGGSLGREATIVLHRRFPCSRQKVQSALAPPWRSASPRGIRSLAADTERKCDADTQRPQRDRAGQRGAQEEPDTHINTSEAGQEASVPSVRGGCRGSPVGRSQGTMRRAAPETAPVPTRPWGSEPWIPLQVPPILSPHAEPPVLRATYRSGVPGSRKCTYPGGPLWANAG